MRQGADRSGAPVDTVPVAALVLLAGVVVLSVPLVGLGSPAASYPATGALAAGIDAAASGALLTAAVVVLVARPFGVPPGPVAALAVSWAAASFVSWPDGPPLIRSLAMVATPLVLPLVVHLAVRGGDRAPSRTGNRFAVAAYAATGALDLGVAAVRDPYLDLQCWDNCRHNVLLVSARPAAADVLVRSGRALAVGLGLGLVVWCGWRLASSSAVARRRLVGLLGPAALVGAAEAAHGAALLAGPREDPRRDLFLAIFTVRALALTAVALGVSWSVWRSVRADRALGRLTAALDLAAPGSFEGTLRRLLGDDTITVAYRSDRLGRFVDSAGGTVADPRTGTGSGSRTTTVLRGDEVVAVIGHHDRASAVGTQLQRRLGAAARLAVDNERLRAELLARTTDLRASRARIVAAADAGRRRVERDLHDGVQQSLLAILFEVRLAVADARRAERPDLVDRLTALVAEVERTLDELRRLARGIYPAILTDAGLVAAVRALAEEAPLPLDVTGDATTRCGAGAELAAYRCIVDIVELAERGRATAAEVRISRANGEMIVSVSHDGERADDADLLPARDRVGAVGGHVLADRSRIAVVVPCGS